MSGTVEAPRAPPAGGRIRRLAPDEWPAVRDVLRDDGVVILSGAAGAEELAEAEALFHRFLGGAGFCIEKGGRRACSRGKLAEQCDDSRWKLLGRLPTGQVTSHGIAHSAFMWHCRRLPGVRKAFQEVWQCDEVVTSFDVAGAARNPFLAPPGADWRTVGGWFHVDQNGNTDRGLETVRSIRCSPPRPGPQLSLHDHFAAPKQPSRGPPRVLLVKWCWSPGLTPFMKMGCAGTVSYISVRGSHLESCHLQPHSCAQPTAVCVPGARGTEYPADNRAFCVHGGCAWLPP